MTRLLTETVEVHLRDGDPDQFFWRDRLYLVREVLARWTEAGQWWRAPAVVAVSSGDSDRPGGSGVGGASGTAGGGAGNGAGGAVPSGLLGVDDGERDWWRVEAGSGRAAVLSGGLGVYDLCHDTATGTWTLARVLD